MAFRFFEMQLKISRVVLAFGLMISVGLCAIIGVSVYGLSQLKVGGPLYDKLKLDADLVADILPPPEYIIESYLEVTLAMRDPASLTRHRERLVQLKKDYDDRHAYWLTSPLDTVLKDRLVKDSHRQVGMFWNLLDRQLLPAIERGDTAAQTAAYAQLSAAYQAHREIVDDIVKGANASSAATEVATAGRVGTLTALLWGISALVLVMFAIGLAGIVKSVVQPIVRMTDVMSRLARGDLAIAVPGVERGDEVGAMARAVQVFRDNALRVDTMESERNVKARAEADRRTAMQGLADRFDAAVGRIVGAVANASSELEQAARQLIGSADTTGRLAGAVSDASHQSASCAQMAAAACREMALSVQEISRQVQQSREISQAAVEQAEQTNERISHLAQSADRIGEVIKLINAIAAQTNLLALNATIEAARAGDAGRGFAVVASEVKALAAQTAKATDEITGQIAQIQTATAESVSAIHVIGGTIAQLRGISGTIAAAVEQQGAATEEIARSVQQAADGATGMSSSIADLGCGATETGNAADHVHRLSSALHDESNHLKIEVERFSATVRAA